MNKKTKVPLKDYYNQDSERLFFRPLTLDDIKTWQPFFIDNPTLRFLGVSEFEHLSAIEKASNWIGRQVDRQANNAFGQLAVISKESDTFLGVGGIIARDIDGVDEFEITYSLLPGAWGKGYATELAIHFKNYAFERIDTPTVVSIIHRENLASKNVARKNGMKISAEYSFLDMPVYIFRISV
ncbi:MAG: GNAT family N-acetyltransferase [Crocinitomicaceae bacterium]|nr:GNAT family N-acetyltransferase [Crocinitomicaceae bacterium]